MIPNDDFRSAQTRNDSIENIDKQNVETIIFPQDDVKLIEDYFGFVKKSKNDSVPIKRFTWTTKNKLLVQLINYGATITKIKAPDRHGNIVDIVLGFDKIEDYKKNNKYYMGSTIGRVVNIVENASFHVGNDIFILSANKNDNQFNGGFNGFDKVLWDWLVQDSKVILSYLSPDGEEGYPGSLLTQISYLVTMDNTISIEIKATTTKPTPVNISNNIYFNLAGHDSGPDEIYDHIFTINAEKYTPSENNIFTGHRVQVGGTIYDLRIPKKLSEILSTTADRGIDVNFCVTQDPKHELSFMSRVLHCKSGRVMEIYSDQPGMQFTTGNLLPDADATGDETENQTLQMIKPLKGKNGALYKRHGGFCLQSQAYPNAMNKKNFPNVILYPDKIYKHNIIMRFGLQLGKYL